MILMSLSQEKKHAGACYLITRQTLENFQSFKEKLSIILISVHIRTTSTVVWPRLTESRDVNTF